MFAATVVLWIASHLRPYEPPAAIFTVPAGSTIPDTGFFLNRGSIGYHRLTWYVGAWEASAQGPSYQIPIPIFAAISAAASIPALPLKRVIQAIRKRTRNNHPN